MPGKRYSVEQIVAKLREAEKLKEREVWRSEYETLEQARAAIGAYVERYHGRPHSTLDYRTPKEVRRIWEDARGAEALRKEAA